MSRKIANIFFIKILYFLPKFFKKVWYNRRMSLQQRVGFATLGILIVGAFFIFDYIHTENSREFLTVAFLDIGQGDSIFIEAPNGIQVLIDSGPTATVIRQLSNVLPFYDRSLDLIIATHHDSDHTAAFPEIIKRYRISQYASSPNDDDDGLFFEIEDLIQHEGADRLTLTAGDRITLDDERGIYINVLWPPENSLIEDNNESSVVTQVIYGDTSFMLTGDLGQDGECQIVASNGGLLNIRSQVLKAGHHGSKTSTSKEFLESVAPEFIIISAGKDNKFGHPHDEVLQTIESWRTNYNDDTTDDLSVEIMETFKYGNIIFQSDGENVWLK